MARKKIQIQTLPGVEKVMKQLESLESVVDCDRLGGRGPTSRGTKKRPYVNILDHIPTGMRIKVHVGCGYQIVRVNTRNNGYESPTGNPRDDVEGFIKEHYH